MKKIFLGVLLMAVVNIVSAQQDTLRKTIDEVVVTANKFGILRRGFYLILEVFFQLLQNPLIRLFQISKLVRLMLKLLF